MPEVPKIVHQRLRAGASAPDQSHPEADVLGAFAEQSLTPAERESVLQHLALCADCRDVVALGLPALEATAQPVREQEQEMEVVSARAASFSARETPRRFSWANLRWATLAAGIAVALLVIRPVLDHRQQNPVASIASQPASAPAAQPTVAEAPRESSPLSLEARKAAAKDSAEAGMQLASNSRSDDVLKDAAKASKKDIPLSNRPAAPARRLDAFSNRGAASPSADKKEEKTAEAAIATPVPSSSSFGSAGTEQTQTEVAVGAESPALGHAAAIEKAKPPVNGQLDNETQKELTAQRTPSPAVGGSLGVNSLRSRDETSAMSLAKVKQSATWIVADGALQHSADGGRTWKKVAGADRSVLCFVSRGQEFWAGGSAGKLLHSVDNAATFSAIAVSFKDQPLTLAISHIDLTDDGKIVLTTDNHETWTSADNGKTWDKQ
ncbi:MAG TPA: zf-HC2 domain-containing protein [Terriglobales bacterium]|nr:zf-HC2 domain-containing protein [Terriglobales bacterium]